MRGLRSFRVVAAVATIGGALLASSDAGAAPPYSLDAAVDGVLAPGQVYAASSLKWDDDGFGMSFTHATDKTTKDLMNLMLARTDKSVTLRQSLNGTVIVKLAGTFCRTDSVHENLNNSNGTEETVAFRCRQIVYTFQPTLANGQPNGPAVSVTYTRGDNLH